jgi:arylsulfatase A-like enzyme
MRARWLFGLGALAALAGCGRARAETTPAASADPSASVASVPAPSASAAEVTAASPPAAPRPGPFNVLLIVIDSLRADMPWAGYRRNIAPNLTRFAKRAVQFTRGYAISPVTARSVAPLLCGTYPSEMERTGHFFTTYYPANLFLGERLQPLGHRTVAVLAHAYFYGGGMKQGFGEYHVLSGTMLDDPEPKPTSERLTIAAERYIARAADPSGEHLFFAYLHYMDPHSEYIEHEDGPDFGKDLRDRYDGEVFYTDRWVGALLSWLGKQPFGPKTAIIVTADHGEGFGEHGHYRHGYEVWEALVHVPLLIYVPGATPRHIDTPRSHIDLAPTILELMGVPADPPYRGKSLVGEIFGAPADPRPVVVDLPRDNLQDRRRAVIDGNLKLIGRGDDERWLLYDLGEDPRETKNLTETEPNEFRRMRKLYFDLSATIPHREIHGDVKLKNAPPNRKW